MLQENILSLDSLDDDTTRLILGKLNQRSLANMQQVNRRFRDLISDRDSWLQRLYDIGMDQSALAQACFSKSINCYKKICQIYELKKQMISIGQMESFEPVFMSGERELAQAYFDTGVDLGTFKEEDLLLFACLVNDVDYNLFLCHKIIGSGNLSILKNFQALLLAAFKAGNYLFCKKIIELVSASEIEINFRHVVTVLSSRWNLLHYAFRSGVMQCIELAQSFGIDPLEETGNKFNIVSCAIMSRNIHALRKALVLSNNNLKAVGEMGKTPLHLATQCEFLDAIDLFVSLGCDVNATMSDGKNLLHCAFEAGGIAIIERIKLLGIDPHLTLTNGISILGCAITSGSLQAVKLAENLVGTTLASIAHTPAASLHLAVQSGKLDMVKHCVKAGFDINAVDDESFTPLHYLFQDPLGYRMVEELLKLGANPYALDDIKTSILHIAASTGHPALLKIALQYFDVNVTNQYGNSPIFYARGHQTFKLLIERGAEVNISNEDGMTPLMIAASKGDVLSCELLLAQPQLKKFTVDSAGFDALTYAIFHTTNLELLELLVKAGFQVNITVNRRGIAMPLPLVLASGDRPFAIFKKLVDLGMDITNCKAPGGQGLLHHAVAYNRFEMLENLLSHYPHLDLTENDLTGRSAYDMACVMMEKHDNPTAMNIIQAHLLAQTAAACSTARP
ncbi:MAG: ankyrin repeat domain-containing protein [Gammaproteobacteria bacterium]|nr:ankyrin repeat domain-containing protein [Gammaproteobacteria bacterium]